jgi:hypothetical protein
MAEFLFQDNPNSTNMPYVRPHPPIEVSYEVVEVG